MSDIQDRIKELLSQNDVIIFMKGTQEEPMCGFSFAAVKILSSLLDKFSSVDVLEDEEIRAGIKEYSQWPTIPQLYIKGEFIGGSDIIQEMYESGELQEKLKQL